MEKGEKICAVEGCNVLAKKRNLCKRHYAKERLESIQEICQIAGCSNKVYLLKYQWCSLHYWRWYRSGNPEYTKHPPHGYTGTTEFTIWVDIKMRTGNPADPAYKNYGGRGIKFYEPWRESFLTFREYLENSIGLRPNKQLTLDRIDNNKDYEPGNLKWSTLFEQANNRRNNVLMTLGNRTQTIMQWCKELGLNYATVKSRLRGGLSDSEALGIGYSPEESLTIKGESKTFREWSAISGIAPGTIRRRSRAGWDENTLLLPVISQDRFVVINGVSKQVYEWVRISGLPRGTINRRIKLGWPSNELLTPPGVKRHKWVP